jgi:hypothetical protein
MAGLIDFNSVNLIEHAAALCHRQNLHHGLSPDRPIGHDASVHSIGGT